MLKVLLNSHFFYPSLGGLENVSLTLAEGFVTNGIECKVITVTLDDGTKEFSFDVIRNPNKKQKIELVKWADVILFNGASMALQPWVLLYRKPFVWVHQGYQVSCIDGLGWVDGNSAPIGVYKSIIYHIKLRGLKAGITDGAKLILRGFIAKNLVTKNIAITTWVQNLQPLPNQVQIYNPFPLDQFLSDFEYKSEPEYDFVYLGRIVSEKGVSTLLKAVALLIHQQGIDASLLLIGDGKWRGKMETLATDLKISDFVTFAGKKSGPQLVESVSKGKIAVIPSEWYEPMGGVALELMAAGKNLIASEYGGLKECVGDAGLTFKNGDSVELAECMSKLLNDEALQEEQKVIGKERVKQFHPSIFVAQYITLLKSIINKR
ncbi:glycosyltransferase family 4 protein [Mucilaginibacter sp.]